MARVSSSPSPCAFSIAPRCSTPSLSSVLVRIPTLALPVELGLQSVQIFLDVVYLCLQAVGLCLDCRKHSTAFSRSAECVPTTCEIFPDIFFF